MAPVTEPVPRRRPGRHAKPDAEADARADHGGASDASTSTAVISPPPTVEFLAGAAVAILVGGGLSVAAWRSAVGLLVVVAVTQLLVAVAFAWVTVVSGRTGALIIAGIAAAASDVAVSVWPHGRLGTLLPVLGLAIPAMFVHQLARGAARVRIIASLAGTGMLVALVIALPALIQLRHEFLPATSGGRLVAGVVAAAAGALVVGYFVDMIMPAPRFDAAVPRGLLAVVAAGGLGGSIGHVVMAEGTQFDSARATFAGAAVGALTGFFAVAAAFIQHSATSTPGSTGSTGGAVNPVNPVNPVSTLSAFGRRMRPVHSSVFPLALVAPVAFLLCLAIRT
jgi:hypothetical protein